MVRSTQHKRGIPSCGCISLLLQGAGGKEVREGAGGMGSEAGVGEKFRWMEVKSVKRLPKSGLILMVSPRLTGIQQCRAWYAKISPFFFMFLGFLDQNRPFCKIFKKKFIIPCSGGHLVFWWYHPLRLRNTTPRYGKSHSHLAGLNNVLPWFQEMIRHYIFIIAQQKCRQYWPEKVKDKIRYGDIDVTFEKEELWPDCQVRTFKIQMVCKSSHHFWYKINCIMAFKMLDAGMGQQQHKALPVLSTDSPWGPNCWLRAGLQTTRILSPIFKPILLNIKILSFLL